MPQFVRLINKGKAPYDFHVHQVKRIIKPGEDAMIPWDVACSLFGDPNTTDTGTDPVRTRAWTQAATMHNYQVGGMTEEDWQRLRPKIETWDVETGERIFMVLEDPEGNKGSVGPTNVEVNQSELLAILRQQQEQINQLLQARGQDAPVQVQGESPMPSQDANGEPDSDLSFGGPILPVIQVTGPSPLDPNVNTSAIASADEPMVLKPSVGGAVPADSDPDAVAALAQASEDTPQTPPSGKGKLAPKPT